MFVHGTYLEQMSVPETGISQIGSVDIFTAAIVLYLSNMFMAAASQWRPGQICYLSATMIHHFPLRLSQTVTLYAQ